MALNNKFTTLKCYINDYFEIYQIEIITIFIINIIKNCFVVSSYNYIHIDLQFLGISTHVWISTLI